MLISRLAHRFFSYPEFVLSGWNTFISLKRITGSFSCFRCLIFKVLCAPFFFRSAWLFYHIFLALSRTFFRSFFSRAFLFYHTVSGLSRTFLLSLVRNFSILPQPIKVCQDFFPLRWALDYSTTLSPSCQRLFSPFCSVCKFCQFFQLFLLDSVIKVFKSCINPFLCQILSFIKERCVWQKSDCSYFGRLELSFCWIFWLL